MSLKIVFATFLSLFLLVSMPTFSAEVDIGYNSFVDTVYSLVIADTRQPGQPGLAIESAPAQDNIQINMKTSLAIATGSMPVFGGVVLVKSTRMGDGSRYAAFIA